MFSRASIGLFACLTLAGLAWSAHADASEPVSRQEHESLRAELEALRAELEAQDDALPRDEAAASFEYLEDRLFDLDAELGAVRPGTSKFLLAGHTAAGFTYRQREESTFAANLAVVLLWQVEESILVEAKPVFTLEEPGETEVDLHYANASWLLHDYMTVGAGQFLTPFAFVNDRLQPPWIGKLPGPPLAFEREVGLAPESSLGAFVRGGLPLGATRMNYVVYVSNGPRLVTTGEHAGQLRFDNWRNVNRSPAVGARIGWLPLPAMEVGYSIKAGRVDPREFGQRVRATLHGLDLIYAQDVQALAGTIDLRTKWIFADIDDATYFEPDGTPRPAFDNQRWGGYVQAAYRPAMVDHGFLRHLEFVYRYDIIDMPRNAPGIGDTDRHTWGVNYWIGETALIKTAFHYAEPSGRPSERAFFAQFAVGF